MTEYEMLIRAVKAAPEDDVPRLVLADWLDEHDSEIVCPRCDGTGNEDAQKIPDDPLLCRECNGLNSGMVKNGFRERAEFIRVQVEMARINAEKSDSPTTERRFRDLIDREFRLYKPVVHPFLNSIRSGSQPDNSCAVFKRGFCDSVSCDMAVWLKLGKSICAEHPVTKVAIIDRQPIHWGGDEPSTDFEWMEELAWHDPFAGRTRIPAPILSLMDEVVFGSLEDANAALSDACLKWANSP